tara:strand:+ start:161 stop:523 length:363 start_codon:yes stop_codon:yes gene_type:complete
MVWSKTKERPKRYLISVGRDKLREKVMEDLWKIVDSEGSSMADEVWDALYMHVERHKKIEPEDDAGDGRIHMERDNVFDDVVANESYDAQEKVVEEVLDAERRVERRMATSDMFRNSGGQ